MKKIICFILAVILLFGTGAFTSLASEGVSITIADVSVAPGTTVEVRISAESAQGIKTLSLLDFSYDKSVLTLIESESGWLINGKIKDVDFDNNVSIITFEDNKVLNEAVFKLVFSVSSAASDAKIAVSCNAIATRMENNSENKLSVTVTDGSIIIENKNPHTHTPGKAVRENEKPASCTASGSYEEAVYCSECKTQISRKTVTVPKTGHNKISHPAEAPTCTKGGNTAYETCSRCDYTTYKALSVDKNAHKWDSGKITREATCVNEGVKTYTCQYDKKHTKTEKLPVDKNNHVNTKNTARVEPTYEKPGYTEGVYCNDCKKYINGHKEIPMKQKEFTDSGNAKKDGENIVGKAGFTISELLSQASDKAFVTDRDGKKVTDAVLATGMKLVLPSDGTFVIIVFGDVDSNGAVTAADARLALRASVGLESFDNAQKKAADTDKNGNVTASDARFILRASVGLEDIGSLVV